VTNVSELRLLFLTIMQTQREWQSFVAVAEAHVNAELRLFLRTGTARACLACESSTHMDFEEGNNDRV